MESVKVKADISIKLAARRRKKHVFAMLMYFPRFIKYLMATLLSAWFRNSTSLKKKLTFYIERPFKVCNN